MPIQQAQNRPLRRAIPREKPLPRELIRQIAASRIKPQPVGRTEPEYEEEVSRNGNGNGSGNGDGDFPTKLDGSPDLRFKENATPGTASYDRIHRGEGSGGDVRQNRPMGNEGDITNQDGTLDMRFLENRIKAGLVPDVVTARYHAELAEPHVRPHLRLGKK
jgi:hypothetical protein